LPDFDENIRKSLEDNEVFKGIIKQLEEAATSEVTVMLREPCGKDGCQCKHVRYMKVPAYDTKLKVMDWLANRGVGRPQQAEGEQGEKIQFERVVYLGDE
jgi:hypothetical protein